MASYNVEFNRLALSARQRLAELLTNRRDPAFVYATGGHRDGVIAKIVFAVLFGLGALLLMVLIPTEFEHDRTGREQLAVMLAGALFLTLACAFSVLYRLIWKPPKWNWDVYLATGACMVHVQRSRVLFAPTDDLGRPRIVHRYRNGSYMGSTIAFPGALTFPFTTESGPTEFLDALSNARQRYQHARQAGDAATVRALNPFWEGAERGGYEEPGGGPRGEPTVTTIPVAVRIAGWFGALFLAGGVAGAFYFLIEILLDAT